MNRPVGAVETAGGAGAEVAGLTVELGRAAVVRDVAWSVPRGRIGALLGPSGAGKSTILRAIAGLVRPSAGTISLGGETVFGPGVDVDPARRRVGFLFQGYALWPNMSVAEHLDFALSGFGTPRAERAARIDETLAALGIGALRARRPESLSGGERQRLALARALVTRPAAILLDEPTSSLDPGAARDARELISGLNRRFGATVVLVTHDQDEALSLGDRVCVLDGGRVLQEGAPEEVYGRPRSARVARFVGEGALLEAAARPDGGADTALGRADLAGQPPAARFLALVRPETLRLCAAGDGVAATVESCAFRGGLHRATVAAGGARVQVDAPARLAAGAAVRVAFAAPAVPVPLEETG